MNARQAIIDNIQPNDNVDFGRFGMGTKSSILTSAVICLYSDFNNAVLVYLEELFLFRFSFFIYLTVLARIRTLRDWNV